MGSTFSQAQNVFESGSTTVTSGGHWFHATRKTIEEYVPGLLKKVSYERLVLDAVAWVESPDSIAMLLYFGLIFLLPTVPATLLALLFYVAWYFGKSSMVTLWMTPVIKLLNLDLLQIAVAALALTFLGMGGNYSGLLVGILFFFLFKVGLLRLFLYRIGADRIREGLPLNDRVLKMVLVRYSIREDLVPEEVQQLEDGIKGAILTLKEKTKR